MPGSRRPLGLARPFQARAAARPGVWQVCSWPGPGLVPGPRPGSGSGPAWPLAARPPALPGCWGILEHNLGAARFCVFITYTTHNTHITQESRDHQRRSALRGRESEEEEQRGSSSVRRKMKQRAEAIALAAGLKLSNEQCTGAWYSFINNYQHSKFLFELPLLLVKIPHHIPHQQSTQQPAGMYTSCTSERDSWARNTKYRAYL